MVKYNHYLKELGVEETDYPFNKIDDRYEPDEEGFVSAEFFSLNYTLALHIYSHLCYFRDNCICGTPFGMDEKEWRETLNRMIAAFALIITEDDDFVKESALCPEDRKIASKRRKRKIARGMRDFIKYFNALAY